MELKNNTFQTFKDLLDERFCRKVYTTEDSIRYTFYAALLSTTELEPIDLILEDDHCDIEGAKIDTVVCDSNGKPAIAFEFKYDRRNRGGTNQNQTVRAAKVMNDIFRLARLSLPATDKYFIYITDSEMAGYFKSTTNQLQDIFDLTGPAQLPIATSRFSSLSPTFTTHIHDLVCDCAVASAFSAQLSGDRYLRAFQVRAGLANGCRNSEWQIS